jgi:predicted MFS family arabinose efflux permease
MSNSSDPTQLLTAGVLIGFGLSGAGFTVVIGAVGRAAPLHKRAQALAITTTGGSLGQFIAIPYVQALLGSFDWVFSLLVMVGTSLLILPLTLSMWNNRATDVKTDQTIGQAIGEARKHSGFWLLTAGFFVCGFNLAFIGLHLPAYVRDYGFDLSLAANGLMLIGLFNIIGTYGFGILGGRFSKKKVLASIYLGRSLVFLVFLLMPLSETTVLLFSGAMGLLWLGTVPLTSGLVATIFGPAYLSMLYGVVYFSHQVGSFSGAWLAGVLYDSTGSYEVMWWLNVGLGILAAALHWPIKEHPVERVVAVGTD